MIPTRCPDCLQPGTVPDNAAGKTVRCRKCSARFKVTGPTEPPVGAEVVDFQLGLPAPGEEPIFDLSKLDDPAEEVITLEVAPDQEPEPRPLRKEKKRKTDKRHADDEEHEDEEEDLQEVLSRRRNRRQKLPLSLFISISCLILSAVTIGVVFSKISELNRVKEEINKSPSGKKVR